MSYFIAIKWAILLFPLVALFFTLPFLFVEYHKNGALSLLKSVFIYLFVFYLLSAYFLVILPLPKISEVANLTTPRMQLIPFSFVVDFITHTSCTITNPSTCLFVFKESYFFIPAFNILLTVPFGMFLRYFKKMSLKRVLLCSFLLSLFFELTQLSGLYFIYPRGYRLFDVDDLILNTLGGGVGYFLCEPFLFLLPSVDKLNEESRKHAEKVTGLRKVLTVFLDVILFQCLFLFLRKGLDKQVAFLLSLGIYFLVIPIINKSSTMGMQFFHLAIVDLEGYENKGLFILRKIYFLLLYLLIPSFAYYMIRHNGSLYIKEVYGTLMMGCLFLFQCIAFIKYCFTSKEMLFAKMSKTKMISTI